MNKQRATALSAVAGFAVAAAVALFVYSRNAPVSDAGQTPGYNPSLLNRSAPGPSGAAGPSGPSPSGSSGSHRLHVVFLGDDYTAGVGASSAANSWTTLVAQRLDLDATVVGRDGAGYAKPGSGGTTYRSMIDRVVAADPDVVVVSGGRNDVTDYVPTLQDDARSLFHTLHQRLAQATLVAIAPWWGDSPHPGKLTPVDDAVRAAVDAAGGSYLNLSDPLAGHPDWMADEADPNDRGYQAIASSVSAALADRISR
jgi:acyl-CoA thioesterase-1